MAQNVLYFRYSKGKELILWRCILLPLKPSQWMAIVKILLKHRPRHMFRPIAEEKPSTSLAIWAGYGTKHKQYQRHCLILSHCRRERDGTGHRLTLLRGLSESAPPHRLFLPLFLSHQLTSQNGGSFGFLAARLRSRRAEFPLYHAPQHLSREKFNKILYI